MYYRVHYHNRLWWEHKIYTGLRIIENIGWFLDYLEHSRLRDKGLNLWTLLLIMSFKHQLLGFTLTLIITVRKGLLVDSASRFIARFGFKTWNSSCFWLGDIKSKMKRQILLAILTSKLMHLSRLEIFKTLKESADL